MSIVVFWLEQAPDSGLTPVCQGFNSRALTQALNFANGLRAQGYSHVTLSSELEDCVSLAGVTSVENGLTPDGQPYDWSKQHRGQNFKSK